MLRVMCEDALRDSGQDWSFAVRKGGLRVKREVVNETVFEVVWHVLRRGKGTGVARV